MKRLRTVSALTTADAVFRIVLLKEEPRVEGRSSRREFLKRALQISGAASVSRLFSSARMIQPPSYPDIGIVSGESPATMTVRVLELIGGINRFVRRGDKVVILPNPQGSRPGVSTNGEILSEVIKQCWNVGASEVTVASIHAPGRWYSSGITSAVEKADAKIFYPQEKKDWIEPAIPIGKALKRAVIVRRALEADAFINIPIIKQHDSTRLTGCLKNLMGFHRDNASLHQAETILHQGIADLATLFKPKLLIIDAVRILGENGPFGPGKLLNPRKVLAGTDMVALDAYCCRFLNLRPTDVEHIDFARANGIGVMDVTRLRVEEINL